MELRVHRIQNAARFLLAQVEVAVARDAKGSRRENLGIRGRCARRRRARCRAGTRTRSLPSADGRRRKPRKRARHGDHAQIDLRIAFGVALQQKRQAQAPCSARAGKGCAGSTVTGVSSGSTRSEIETLDGFARLRLRAAVTRRTRMDSSRQRGNQLLAPAVVLVRRRIRECPR